jgi:diacylglycerol kinase family enzyme
MSSTTPAPICLLVNPTAGGGRAGRRARLVAQALEGYGLLVRSLQAGDRDHVSELAGVAADAGETVVTLGGDGIAGAAADGLREVPGAVLGIIPSGRGNDLVRVLGIPSDPHAACAIIARGIARPMDLGEVDGRAFVGIASVGFDSDANRIANRAPAWLGSGVYAYGALRALLRWRPASFQLELYPGEPATQEPSPRAEGGPARRSERIDFAGYSVAFANSRCFGGGMRLAPAALLDDGVLDVVRIEQMTRAGYAWHLPKVFRGTHLSVRCVHFHRVAEAVISADRPFTMYADGDPIGELPVRVRVLPGAIHVLTPALGAEAFATSSRGRQMPTRLREEAPGAPVSELSGGSPGGASLS